MVVTGVLHWFLLMTGISQFLFVLFGSVAVYKYRIDRGEKDVGDIERKQQEQQVFCNTCSTNMKVFMGSQGTTNVMIKDTIQSLLNSFEKLHDRVQDLEKMVTENSSEIKNLRERFD